MPNQVNLNVSYVSTLMVLNQQPRNFISNVGGTFCMAYYHAVYLDMIWSKIYHLCFFSILCVSYIYNHDLYDIYYTNLTAQRASYLKDLGNLHHKSSLIENLYDWNNDIFSFLIFCTWYHDQCGQHQLNGWILNYIDVPMIHL